MKDYNKILDITNNSTDDEIDKSYKTKLERFRNLPFLTTQMKVEVKDLHEAHYVTSNSILRKKYYKKFNKETKYMDETRNIDNTKICDRLFSITFMK
jgi:hypothetical protein